MRLLLVLILLLPALAQEPAAKTEEKTASPVPSAEQWLSGSIDVGYRWMTDVQGSAPSYKSIVNLGSGPKLFGFDFTVQNPSKKLIDRLDVRGNAWGGDPYNTAHVNARKAGIYDFNFDYRNIAYFNALPSYANPLAPNGFDQQSFNTARRVSSFDLDLLPGKRFIPYLAYERDAGRGTGVGVFVEEGNEYAVPNRLRDKTDNFRGGLRMEFKRFHVTLEQGGTKFSDSQDVGTANRNVGNRTTPFLGQSLTLTNLQQAYGITGSSIYSRALVTANPTSWLNLFGQFLYSRPKTDVTYSDLAAGNFVAISSLLFYNGQQDVASGEASRPHSSANVGFELRPWHRLRIVESLMTDRYHNATFGTLTEQLLLSGKPGPSLVSALNDRLVMNYNQQQVDVMFDLTSKITVRGGHRYVWGDSSVRTGQLSQIGGLESGLLRRNVGLAGFSIRPTQKISASADYEGASSDHAYLRISLYNYQKLRARARYQATSSLSFQANFSFLDNQNPTAGIRYDFRSRADSFTVFWTPKSGKYFTLTGDYTRSTLRSDIGYLTPQTLAPALSNYRDKANTATAVLDVPLPGYGGLTPKLSLGGSLFSSSGSRASSYYQPLARLSMPIQKHVYWNTEWRWYGYGEQFYYYEAFRVHAFTTGLRFM